MTFVVIVGLVLVVMRCVPLNNIYHVCATHCVVCLAVLILMLIVGIAETMAGVAVTKNQVQRGERRKGDRSIENQKTTQREKNRARDKESIQMTIIIN